MILEKDPAPLVAIRPELCATHEEQTKPENKLSQNNQNKSINSAWLTMKWSIMSSNVWIRSARYNYNVLGSSGVSLLHNSLGGWLNFDTLRKHFLKAGVQNTVRLQATGV